MLKRFIDWFIGLFKKESDISKLTREFDELKAKRKEFREAKELYNKTRNNKQKRDDWLRSKGYIRKTK